jgi:hypothetical protein
VPENSMLLHQLAPDGTAFRTEHRVHGERVAIGISGAGTTAARGTESRKPLPEPERAGQVGRSH